MKLKLILFSCIILLISALCLFFIKKNKHKESTVIMELKKLHKNLHSISFSIPEEKIVPIASISSLIGKKTKILSSLIPGNIKTYIYNTEEDYYNEYRKSFFATTTKKAGWDCMRHYEIIANGCIPYFPNIEQCPYRTMPLQLKELFVKGNELFRSFNKKMINQNDLSLLSLDDIDKYKILLNEFLHYMTLHLTTTRMARYILEETKFEDVSRILYLSGDTSPDYLRCVTLHGFKLIFGENCHDYPKVPHIYKTDSINYKTLYGKGMTYSNLLDNRLHNNELDNNIENDIKNKYYDIVIYGSYHRGMPYYNLISSIYKPNEIILLCGEDIHKCNYKKWIDKGHNVFVRELV